MADQNLNKHLAEKDKLLYVNTLLFKDTQEVLIWVLYQSDKVWDPKSCDRS